MTISTFISITIHLVTGGEDSRHSSTTHSVFLWSSLSISGGLGSLFDGVTQIFIYEGSGSFFILSKLSCHSLPSTLVTGDIRDHLHSKQLFLSPLWSRSPICFWQSGSIIPNQHYNCLFSLLSQRHEEPKVTRQGSQLAVQYNHCCASW